MLEKRICFLTLLPLYFGFGDKKKKNITLFCIILNTAHTHCFVMGINPKPDKSWRTQLLLWSYDWTVAFWERHLASIRYMLHHIVSRDVRELDIAPPLSLAASDHLCGMAAKKTTCGPKNIFSIDHHYKIDICKTVDRTPTQLETRLVINICMIFFKPTHAF